VERVLTIDESCCQRRSLMPFERWAKDKANPKKKAAENKDVFLEFLGHKILIKKDGEGRVVVDEKDIPFVKGVTLKFDGYGDVTWSEIKVKSSIFILSIVFSKWLVSFSPLSILIFTLL